jgi:hypothetical protein
LCTMPTNHKFNRALILANLILSDFARTYSTATNHDETAAVWPDDEFTVRPFPQAAFSISSILLAKLRLSHWQLIVVNIVLAFFLIIS